MKNIDSTSSDFFTVDLKNYYTQYFYCCCKVNDLPIKTVPVKINYPSNLGISNYYFDLRTQKFVDSPSDPTPYVIRYRLFRRFTRRITVGFHTRFIGGLLYVFPSYIPTPFGSLYNC